MRTKSMYLVVLVLALALASPGRASLISHWEFDGDLTDSVGSNNGTAVGGPLTYIPGQFGQGIYFDGLTQSVTVPHDASLKPADAITISMLVKPDGLDVTKSWQTVYRKEDGTPRHLFAFGGGDAVTVGLWIGMQIGGGKYKEWRGDVTRAYILDGNWHLIAATYDGAAVNLYLDTQLLSSGPKTGAIGIAGSANLYIGAGTNGLSEFYKGGIDDVRLYDHALSPSELSALVPEPATLALLGLGGLSVLRRRKP